MTIQGDSNSTYFTTDATTDGQTSTAHRQRFLGAVLTAGSGAAATLDIYDAQSATGTPILSLRCVTSGQASYTVPAMGKICETNIFADIGGSGATATIYWN